MTYSGDVPPYADSEIIMKPIDGLVDRLRFHTYCDIESRSLHTEAADRIEALEALLEAPTKEEIALYTRIEALEDALQHIVQWSEAYPLDIFPEPDWKKVDAILKAGDVSLSAVSASNMRHVVEGVGKIARDALAPEPDK